MTDNSKKGLAIFCPRCGGKLNVSTSERPSLISVKAILVCCNPRCDGYRCDFVGEMLNFRTATFREAPEISSWTKTERNLKDFDEKQLGFDLADKPAS